MRLGCAGLVACEGPRRTDDPTAATRALSSLAGDAGTLDGVYTRAMAPSTFGDSLLIVAADTVRERDAIVPPRPDEMPPVRVAAGVLLLIAGDLLWVAALATPTTLYVVVKDEDDLERLIAYRLLAQIR